MLRHPFVIGVAMVALTLALALGASKARAEPIVGERILSPRAIVCDEEAQIDEFVAAIKQGDGSVTAVAQKYHDMKDEKGEPACELQPMGSTVLASTDLGRLEAGKVPVHAWKLQIGGAGATGWALYGEAINETPA
jgi:hypothetical protein